MLTSHKSFGLMLDYYISDIVRNRVLREIASRAQKVIFNVAYPWYVGKIKDIPAR